MRSKKQNIVIIGAGPAGLSAAYNLLKNSNKYKVIIIEEDKQVGGISKTITYDNYKMDLGGHRFFSKNKQINELWQELLPIQGKNSIDDIILDNTKKLNENGPNPECDDETLLIRNRVSRIYYNKKFFDYPVKLNLKTIKNLGFFTTILCGLSYIKSCIKKVKVESLETFYISRFGKKLYNLFFKNYTEKVWGTSPKNISPEWGSQRAKGLSIRELLKDYFQKILHIENKDKETSLIESFLYPKYGPGQMWEEMAKRIEQMGGKIIYNAKVDKIYKKNNKILEISYTINKKKVKKTPDYLISSIPIKDLCTITNNIPKEVKQIATTLPYRDFITVGLIVKKLNIQNQTNIKTINNIVPDNWIYIQEKQVKIGRIQIFNNWSPYLVNDFQNTVSLGIEYFCQENGWMWKLSEQELIDFTIKELEKINIISKENVINSHIEKVKKAYPAYFGSYQDFDIVKNYLNKIDNLYCIGRNGQHRYNNMDHSMLTGIEASNNIINNITNKDNIWNINTEKEYLEQK